MFSTRLRTRIPPVFVRLFQFLADFSLVFDYSSCEWLVAAVFPRGLTNGLFAPFALPMVPLFQICAEMNGV